MDGWTEISPEERAWIQVAPRLPHVSKTLTPDSSNCDISQGLNKALTFSIPAAGAAGTPPPAAGHPPGAGAGMNSFPSSSGGGAAAATVGKGTPKAINLWMLGGGVVVGVSGLYYLYKYFTRKAFDWEQIDFSQTVRITKAQVSAIWDQIDVDEKGYIEPKDIHILVDSILRKIAFSANDQVIWDYVESMFSSHASEESKQACFEKLKNLLELMVNTKTWISREIVQVRLGDTGDERLYDIPVPPGVDPSTLVTRAEFSSFFAMYIEDRFKQWLLM